MNKTTAMLLIEERHKDCCGLSIDQLILRAVLDDHGLLSPLCERWSKSNGTISRWIDRLGIRGQINAIRKANDLYPIGGDLLMEGINLPNDLRCTECGAFFGDHKGERLRFKDVGPSVDGMFKIETLSWEGQTHKFNVYVVKGTQTESVLSR